MLENLEVLKTAVLGAVDFVHMVNFSLQKMEKFIKKLNSEPLNVVI